MAQAINGHAMEQWIQISALYLQEAAQQLRDEGRLHEMHVDTTITDADGSRVIAKINIKTEGKSGKLVASNEMDSLSRGELLLAIGSALSMYTEASSHLYATASHDDDEQED
ncbi:hypothetical protein [Bifidobacterium animalis]|uniref:Uncharacterized protein n=1 Tax=Bifidobacterium animalis subsp. lactis TaxID=302911 RepID=A0A8B3RK83_BIFAN|nr:hypothetical protein [Bifidobacterium animalis]RYM96103.1 hypothetical protein PG2011B_0300 [Bifidobacterium animalis subsp. lactis]